MAKKKQKLVKSKTPFKGHKELHSSSVKNGRSNVSVPSNKKAMKKATGNCLENNDESESSEFEEVPASRSNAKKLTSHTNPEDEAEEYDEFEEEQKNTRKLVQKQNRKNKKSGGFQSMGLSFPVYKGIMKKGYKVPTPIQRKTIPLIMDGRDVVAMARTGSGKTAAFLIPMFERLKAHSAKSGARTLILSPTRELALQTLKFTKELGKFTGLRAAVILGGDRMEDQFEAMHENPDIIIGTPGRFMHLLVEMELKLSSVEYIVFDEADRLFEMGFREQLEEILRRLPESRQTVLFSATLPKLLVDFAKAGLHDPTLVRLDVDTKLSENLKLAFLHCKSDNKLAVLLHLLQNVIEPKKQTVIFVATKHHVEYLYMLLSDAGISCSYSYSSLDHTARKINVAKFQNKNTTVLIVTDLAARGIDIPMLDNVINYNFPAKPKLFVHRVGRVARAGRSGTAYSIVSPDEVVYVMDLHLFLGRPMKLAIEGKKYKDDDCLYGSIPQRVIDDEEDTIRTLHQKSELVAMKKVTNSAYKQYVRSRPAPSAESFKRVKSILEGPLDVHPLFGETNDKVEHERTKMIDNMKNYRPNMTVFEMSSNRKTQAYSMMKAKRDKHGKVIEAKKKSKEQKDDLHTIDEDIDCPEGVDIYAGDDVDLKTIFSRVIAPKRASDDQVYVPKKKKRRLQVKDEENYLSYRPKDFHAELGLSLGSSFHNEAAGAMLDLTGDDEQKQRKMNNQLKWDRKKKKFVRDASSDSKKKIKTESGAWISASYKTNIYKDWLSKSKAAENKDSDSDVEVNKKSKKKGGLQVLGHGPRRKKAALLQAATKPGKRHRPELKRKEQILKRRKKDAQKRNFQKYRERKHSKQSGKKKKH